MRKIENKQDWMEFVADVQCFIGEENGFYGFFAISQDGDGWIGYFETEIVESIDDGFYREVSFKDERDFAWFRGEEFFEELLGAYDLPFYICDPCANETLLLNYRRKFDAVDNNTRSK